jgi:thioester reductase-like protein
LISGATGLIGSFLVDVLMYRNSAFGMNCHVYALGRNGSKARERFAVYWDNPLFEFIAHDISAPFSVGTIQGLYGMSHSGRLPVGVV